MQRYFINEEDFSNNRINEVHHIKNVMRMNIGDDIIVVYKKSYMVRITDISDYVYFDFLYEIEENKELDIQEILELLPHRYPFLLVDRVLSYNIDGEHKTLRGLKNVSFNEPFFTGHFPGKPVCNRVCDVADDLRCAEQSGFQ